MYDVDSCLTIALQCMLLARYFSFQEIKRDSMLFSFQETKREEDLGDEILIREKKKGNSS